MSEKKETFSLEMDRLINETVIAELERAADAIIQNVAKAKVEAWIMGQADLALSEIRDKIEEQTKKRFDDISRALNTFSTSGKVAKREITASAPVPLVFRQQIPSQVFATLTTPKKANQKK